MRLEHSCCVKAGWTSMGWSSGTPGPMISRKNNVRTFLVALLLDPGKHETLGCIEGGPEC